MPEVVVSVDYCPCPDRCGGVTAIVEDCFGLSGVTVVPRADWWRCSTCQDPLSLPPCAHVAAVVKTLEVSRW